MICGMHAQAYVLEEFHLTKCDEENINHYQWDLGKYLYCLIQLCPFMFAVCREILITLVS